MDKCIVKGCSNYQGKGKFVGTLCAPCHTMLTQGRKMPSEAWFAKPWVGLTDQDKNNCLVSADPCESLSDPEAQQLMKDVEAKLREKNGG